MDFAAYLLSSLLLVADMRQTEYISQSAEYYETNPLYGKNPSKNKIRLIYGAYLAGNTALYFAPDKYKRAKYNTWGALIFYQSLHVALNKQAGIKILF